MSETATEVYQDQFTPWIPNHLVEDRFIMSADEVYTGYWYSVINGNDETAANTLALLFSSLFVNGYLGIMSTNYGSKR